MSSGPAPVGRLAGLVTAIVPVELAWSSDYLSSRDRREVPERTDDHSTLGALHGLE